MLDSPIAFSLNHKFCCYIEERSKLCRSVWTAVLCLASLLPLLCYFYLTHFCQALYDIPLPFSSVPTAIYAAVLVTVYIHGFQNGAALLLLHWWMALMWITHRFFVILLPPHVVIPGALHVWLEQSCISKAIEAWYIWMVAVLLESRQWWQGEIICLVSLVLLSVKAECS